MTTDTPDLDEQEAAPAAPTDEQAALPASERVGSGEAVRFA